LRRFSSVKNFVGFTLCLYEALVTTAFYFDARDLKSARNIRDSPATPLPCNFAADRSAPEENLATTAIAASKFCRPLSLDPPSSFPGNWIDAVPPVAMVCDRQNVGLPRPQFINYCTFELLRRH
jgi:hypothetical protein